MIRMSQEHAARFAHQRVLNMKGEPAYETGFWNVTGGGVLCVAAPQEMAAREFEKIDACADATFDLAAIGGVPIHSVFGVPPELVFWTCAWPGEQGIDIARARWMQDHCFVTSEDIEHAASMDRAGDSLDGAPRNVVNDPPVPGPIPQEAPADGETGNTPEP